MQISAASLYSGSPPKNAARIFAARLAPLTAVMTMALFSAHLTTALRSTSTVHTVPWLSAPPGSLRHQAGQAVEGDRRGAVRQADRRGGEHPPVHGAPCRTRHWVSAVWAIGTTSA